MGSRGRLLLYLAWIGSLYFVSLYFFVKGFFLSKYELFEKAGSEGPGTSSVVTVEPQFQKMIWIVIDAWRYDFGVWDDTAASADRPPPLYKNAMPTLRNLSRDFPDHARMFRFIADPPTATTQRLKGLMTGGLPTFFDIRSTFDADEQQEDNLLHQLGRLGKKVVVLGDETWLELYRKEVHREMCFPSFDALDLDTVDDGILSFLWDEVPMRDSDVLIAHFLGVDHAGHRYVTDHPAMRGKLEMMDEVIARVAAGLDDETLLLVYGDHGMTDEGSHGGALPEETDSLLFAYSRKPFAGSLVQGGVEVAGRKQDETQLGGEPGVIPQVDMASTLALVMGAPIPFNNLGTVIPELFPRQRESASVSDKGNFRETASAEDWKIHAQAHWANARQVKRFVEVYERTTGSRLLDEGSRSEIEETFRSAQAAWDGMESADGEKTLRSLAGQVIANCRRMTGRVLDSCKEKWATFDSAALTFALLATTLWLCACVLLVLSLPNEWNHKVAERQERRERGEKGLGIEEVERREEIERKKREVTPWWELMRLPSLLEGVLGSVFSFCGLAVLPSAAVVFWLSRDWQLCCGCLAVSLSLSTVLAFLETSAGGQLYTFMGRSAVGRARHAVGGVCGFCARPLQAVLNPLMTFFVWAFREKALETVCVAALFQHFFSDCLSYWESTLIRFLFVSVLLFVWIRRLLSQAAAEVVSQKSSTGAFSPFVWQRSSLRVLWRDKRAPALLLAAGLLRLAPLVDTREAAPGERASPVIRLDSPIFSAGAVFLLWAVLRGAAVRGRGGLEVSRVWRHLWILQAVSCGMYFLAKAHLDASHFENLRPTGAVESVLEKSSVDAEGGEGTEEGEGRLITGKVLSDPLAVLFPLLQRTAPVPVSDAFFEDLVALSAALLPRAVYAGGLAALISALLMPSRVCGVTGSRSAPPSPSPPAAAVASAAPARPDVSERVKGPLVVIVGAFLWPGVLLLGPSELLSLLLCVGEAALILWSLTSWQPFHFQCPSLPSSLCTKRRQAPPQGGASGVSSSQRSSVPFSSSTCSQSEVFLLILLWAAHSSFSTGVRKNIPSLPLEAAFVGFVRYHPWYSAVLLYVRVHIFVPFAVVGAVVAALIGEKRKDRAKGRGEESPQNRSEEEATESEAFRIEELAYDSASLLACLIGGCATCVVCSELSLVILRRHLMVWNLFAPKWMFDSLQTASVVCMAPLAMFLVAPSPPASNRRS